MLMTETYTVRGEYLFITNAPQTLERITRGFAEAVRYGERYRSLLKEIGEQAFSLEKAGKYLKELNGTGLEGLSSSAKSATFSFDAVSASIGKAREQIRLMAEESARLSFGEVNTPVPRNGAGGSGSSGAGGSGSSHKEPSYLRRAVGFDIPGYKSPGIATFVGGTALYETAKTSFDAYARTQQVYDTMLSDSRVRTDPAMMKVIQDSATDNLRKYKTLSPYDAARNSAEGYALSGGEKAEQPIITDLLGQIEENMILRGKSSEDAQQQARMIVSGMDIGNRFYNRKTGQLDLKRMYHEAEITQALVDVGGGFTTGRAIREFFKSTGTVGQDMSAVGLARAAHFIETNPQRAPQAIRSFVSLFEGSASTMRKRDKAWWTEHGLYGKNGRLSEAADALLHSDPIGFVEKYLGRFTRQQISEHTQRGNVGSILNEIQGSQGNIDRQAEAVARTDVNANHAALLEGPSGSVKVLDAAIARFMTTLGKFEVGPGIKILNQMTDGLDRMSNYMNAHPKDVATFMQEIGHIASALGSFVLFLGKVSAAIPSWLKPILFGGVSGAATASVVPGLGTGTGAVTGAATVGLDELASYLKQQDHRLNYDDGAPLTWKDKLDPFQWWHHRERYYAPPQDNLQPANSVVRQPQSQPTQVTVNAPVYLDGKKISDNTQIYVMQEVQRTFDREMRASNAMPDPLSTPRLPGVPWGH